MGGNIGACTVEMLLRTDAVVAVFEPNPSNLFYLTSSLKAAARAHPSLAHRVAVFPLALGNASRTSQIFESKGNAGDSSIDSVSPQATGHWTQATGRWTLPNRMIAASFPVLVRSFEHIWTVGAAGKRNRTAVAGMTSDALATGAPSVELTGPLVKARTIQTMKVDVQG